MKHKHHDLIVQWAKDTSQKVWSWYPRGYRWEEAQTPSWYESIIYKIQEDKPTEPPTKKVSFFDGGIELDASNYQSIRMYRHKLTFGWCYELSFHTLDSNGDNNLEEALQELIDKRLKPHQGT